MWEPHDFYDMHSNDEERWPRSRPKCDHCKERIQDESLIDDGGTLYHEECFEEVAEEWVRKYMQRHSQLTENYVN